MILLIVITILTYIRTLFNGLISDDITMHAELTNKGYPVRWKEFLRIPSLPIQDLTWKLFKDNQYLQHGVNIVAFTSLVVMFYTVCKTYFGATPAFFAALLFATHPCNAQVGGWISARWYGISALFCLAALHLNNFVLYFTACLTSPVSLPLALLFKTSFTNKMLILLGAAILYRVMLESKSQCAKSEEIYKRGNLKLNPRKFIVALKSYAYYFTLAMFPIKLGWFHELGEPIDDKLKSFNFHAILSVLLLGTLVLFIGTKAFIGILLFTLFIAPFSNLITFGLFTSERYMIMATMGFSIFLTLLFIHTPIILVIIASLYFARTQLELWAYKDDFRLALYSLLNFDKSGYAWCNYATLMLRSGRPSAAIDLLFETQKRLPDFPTTYYLLYQMHRTIDLCNDPDKAIMYLEKAYSKCPHEHWYKELEDFKRQVLMERINRFKENVAKHSHTRQYIPRTEDGVPNLEPTLVGNTA